MFKFKTSIAALVIATLPALAFAQATRGTPAAPATPATAATPATPATPNIDQRKANQQRRIEQGVKSGELTDREAASLQKGQTKVQRMEDKAKADGVVSDKERKKIAHEQDKQSKRIEREKHDRQRR